MVLNSVLGKLTSMKKMIKDRRSYLSLDDYKNLDDVLNDCFSRVATIAYRDSEGNVKDKIRGGK
jgi:hypothetical protein